MRSDDRDKAPKERGVRDQDIVTWKLSPEQIAQAFENGDRPTTKTYGLIGIHLFGIYFHLELVEVTKATQRDHLKTGCREGELFAVDEEHQDIIESLQVTMDCSFETAEIDDKTYVIYMTPFDA